MTTKIFVNLPVRDLRKSIDFYEKIGFTNNTRFTDNAVACMMLNESIFVMLLTHDRFRNFTKKKIANASKTAQVLLAIDLESKEEVIELIVDAQLAGGSVFTEPQDFDWMYQHGFEDLDGHEWEVLYMDESKMLQN